MSNCPKCLSNYAYEDGAIWVCPECSHEWTEQELKEQAEIELIKDSNGNILKTGDDVIVIKDLKVKGSGGGTIKGGTKVKGIRLSDTGDGHDITCKVAGFGHINLKSEFVKKS